MIKLLAVVGFLGGCGLIWSGHVHEWEKAHGYPYGRMCDPNIFNLYVSSCAK